MSIRLQLQNSIRDRLLRDPYFTTSPLTADAVIVEKRGESANLLSQRVAQMRVGVLIGIPKLSGISTPKVPHLLLSATWQVECFANPHTKSGADFDIQECAENVAALMKYVPQLDHAAPWRPLGDSADCIDLEEIEESYVEDGEGKTVLEISTAKFRVEGIRAEYSINNA